MDTPPPEWQENVENFEPNGKRAILSIFRDYIFFFAFSSFPIAKKRKLDRYLQKKKIKLLFYKCR